MSRREHGALESHVMRLLWRRADGATSRDLSEMFEESERPARTTLLTVLSRLEDKGLVVRTPGPAGAVFTAASMEAEHGAASMSQMLHEMSDRQAALTHFVGHLDADDLESLRRAFGSLER